MRRDIQVFLDFLSTTKRAQRVSQLYPRGPIGRGLVRTVVFIGRVHDMWFNPRAMAQQWRELGAK